MVSKYVIKRFFEDSLVVSDQIVYGEAHYCGPNALLTFLNGFPHLKAIAI